MEAIEELREIAREKHQVARLARFKAEMAWEGFVETLGDMAIAMHEVAVALEKEANRRDREGIE